MYAHSKLVLVSYIPMPKLYGQNSTQVWGIPPNKSYDWGNHMISPSNLPWPYSIPLRLAVEDPFLPGIFNLKQYLMKPS